MKQKLKAPKAQLVKAKKELAKTLRMSGYHRSKQKYGESKGPDFPNLKVDTNGIPLSNSFANPTPKKQQHPDAKQFPIANNHKQGFELLLRKEDIQWMNGKKF